MPPVVRSGQLATAGTNTIGTARHVPSVMQRIFMYDAPGNPMLRALTARAQVVPVKSVNPKWMEDEPKPEWDTTTATSLAADTTLDVSNGTYHKAGDILLVPRTGEYIRVVSVAANVLTTTRGFAGSTAVDITTAENFINLGLADMEGNISPVAKATVVAFKDNYTQIRKTPVHLSRTLAQVELYGGNERPRLRGLAGAAHAREWEQIMFHGRKREDTSTATNPIRLCGGLDEFVTTNILSAAGTLSESELFEWLGTVFRYKVDGGSGNRRVLFAGQAIINTITSWGAARIQTNSGAGQRYGFSVRTLITPYGELDLVYHPLLEYEYAGHGYVVDMAGLKIGALQQTILETDIQQTDEDGFKDQYLSELTLMVTNEKAFGIVKGVTY